MARGRTRSARAITFLTREPRTLFPLPWPPSHRSHIDFGHIMGHFKSKFGVKRERSLFVFTPQMADVMGGPGSAAYRDFVGIARRSYNVLRRHGDVLVTLFSLMVGCGIPELEDVSEVDWLRTHLRFGASDEEAGDAFEKILGEALATRSRQADDMIHMLVHS